MSKTLARRIEALEAIAGSVEAPMRFLFSFGEAAQGDEVVEIIDRIACRSHHRRTGEAADVFAARALAEPGEPWTATDTDRPQALDLTTTTDAQLAELEAVAAVLDRENGLDPN